MPKVVGHDETIAKKISCRSCGAVNEYFPNEVRTLWKGKDISGCIEVTQGFNCGQCGQHVVTQSY